MKFGTAFPDYLYQGRGRRMPRNKEDDELPHRSSWRLFVLTAFAAVVFVLFQARLFRLAVSEGTANRLRSEGNRIREQVIPAPRGILFDRSGVPLTRNVPFYWIKKSNCKEDDPVCLQVVSPDTARLMTAQGKEEQLIFRIGREYVLQEKGAHLTGYVGQVSKKELEEYNAHCTQPACTLRPGDMIGRGGLEEEYEDVLRGNPGKELVEVDAEGNKVRSLGEVAPIVGANITTTIDSSLQSLAGSLVASVSGAIVATVPTTGEILALASGPSFDPNAFIRGDESVREILQNRDMPLFNRAISGTYPPGSTFKIVTATAVIEEGKMTIDETINDTGVITVGTYQFHNWYFTRYGKTDGSIALVRALARSNDIYFYRIGEKVGPDGIALWARKYGYGRATGVDLPGEEAGTVPDIAWKKEVLDQPWFLGDTYHFAIGQGNLLTTPIQVHAMTDVVANGGKWCPPHLASDGNKAGYPCHDVGVSKKLLATLVAGMKGACGPGGTAYPLFKFKVKNEKLKVDNVDFLATYESTTSSKPMVEVPVACKTGTAEFGDPRGKTHAWLTAFAPTVNPQIAVTVLVEGGGEGSSVAAPLAQKLLENWFSR